jgi:hypothetical protein
VTFLETVLKDLETLQIVFEEHYDPSGRQLFLLDLPEKISPILVYSEKNPDNILLTISTNYSPPQMGKLSKYERSDLDSTIRDLCIDLQFPFQIGIEGRSLYFTMGLILNVNSYNSEFLNLGVEELSDTYSLIMNQAIALIQEL